MGFNDRELLNTGIEERDYQTEAIDALEKNNWHGIFKMATGTGKTITSLLATRRFLSGKGKIFIIVLVPYIHLVNQWIDNIGLFYHLPIVCCYGLQDSWKDKLHKRVRDYNAGLQNVYIVISTYKSAKNNHFLNYLSDINECGFLIADECHSLGSKDYLEIGFPNFDAELGLSATPERWRDETGTKRIFGYFGDVVYSYDLSDAINKENLSKYYYEPIICTLTDGEAEEYLKLTSQIKRLRFAEGVDEEDIKRLMIKRSNIINHSEDKIEKFFSYISKIPVSSIKNTLVYCPIGRIKEITIRLREIGINARNFDSSQSKTEREELLRRFSSGEVQILTAMKCLDEGVDVPSIEIAHFLASSSNPKEFVQRRGRILRLCKGKTVAKIYDYVVLPEEHEDIFENVARKEMPRFVEFAESSLNKYMARSKVIGILSRYNLESILDKFPWDI